MIPTIPIVGRRWRSLAELYQHAEKGNQAVPLGEQLFAAYRVKFGTDNWRTLLAGRQLASFYGLAGMLDKELSLSEQLVAACGAKLVSDDKVTLSCMEALAALTGVTECSTNHWLDSEEGARRASRWSSVPIMPIRSA